MTHKELENIYKLKNITRYNNKAKLHNESVAEHSFFVSLITLHLCEEYKLNDSQTLKCLIKAILHDMPEIDLNDITHDVKIKLKLHPILKVFEDEYYKKNYAKHAKLFIEQDEIIDNIVELADGLSVLQFVEHELSLGNQLSDWQEILNEINKRIAIISNKLEAIYDKENK